MSIELKPWDAAEYLRTPEDLAMYLDVVLQEDHDSPAMLANTVATAARARGGLTKLAEESGISSERLDLAIQLHGDVLAVLQELLRAY